MLLQETKMRDFICDLICAFEEAESKYHNHPYHDPEKDSNTDTISLHNLHSLIIMLKEWLGKYNGIMGVDYFLIEVIPQYEILFTKEFVDWITAFTDHTPLYDITQVLLKMNSGRFRDRINAIDKYYKSRYSY